MAKAQKSSTDYQTYLDELFELLRIPSVSGDPEHDKDIQAASDWLVARLGKLGFEAKKMKTSFNPVVYGERKSSNAEAPTILIYGHYDVQSPDPLELWDTEPFEPVLKDTPRPSANPSQEGNDSYIYCRGVADDKGQLYIWIAALDEYISKHDDVPCNIKFLIEGAEEEGSRGLPEFLAEHKELLVADACVLSDTHSLSPTQPMICYGLRGLSYFQIELETLKQDAHSGIYGGNVRNAATELVNLLAQLKNPEGKIMIPGFYDSVKTLSEQEVEELAAFPWTEADVTAETGATEVFGESEFSINARAGARPTLDIHGLWSGFQGEGSKTIIPAKAGAKVSMRLVANQDSKTIGKQFRSFVESITPDGVKLTITELTGAEPVLVDRSSSFFQAAETAYAEVFGNKPVYERGGGSIGVVADFKTILGIDSVLMGYGLPDDGLHAPNEKFSVEMFKKGIETSLHFFELVNG